LEKKLRGFEPVRSLSGRLLLQGMVSTAYNWKNVQIVGIIPEEEMGVSTWKENLNPGRFPKNKERGWILIGSKLAKRLRADLGERVVLMTQALDGSIEAKNLKILGLLHMPKLEEVLVVMDRRELAKLAHMEDAVSSFYLRISSKYNLEEADSILEASLPTDLSVMTWKERYPFFEKYWGIFKVWGLVYLSILLFAAALGILNLLYMSVAERYREFGVLMAMGLKPSALRRLVLGETLILATLGILSGGIFTVVVYYLWSKFGLDLSAFAQGLEFLGLSTHVYPSMDLYGIVVCTIMVYIFSLLAGLYPAWRASRLKPVEALRIIR
jgi:ABC-type lipoprotein release transport system permease subunit